MPKLLMRKRLIRNVRARESARTRSSEWRSKLYSSCETNANDCPAIRGPRHALLVHSFLCVCAWEGEGGGGSPEYDWLSRRYSGSRRCSYRQKINGIREDGGAGWSTGLWHRWQKNRYDVFMRMARVCQADGAAIAARRISEEKHEIVVPRSRRDRTCFLSPFFASVFTIFPVLLASPSPTPPPPRPLPVQ